MPQVYRDRRGEFEVTCDGEAPARKRLARKIADKQSPMPTVNYRRADKSDIPAMARIRAAEWESEDYWRTRISRYMNCELHPQHALIERVVYVALDGASVVGLIAGHLTRRHGCDGELEWIDVIGEHRRSGIASELLRILMAWFVEQKALRICVDVDPANGVARQFYARRGAEELNKHWMVWKDVGYLVIG